MKENAVARGLTQASVLLRFPIQAMFYGIPRDRMDTTVVGTAVECFRRNDLAGLEGSFGRHSECNLQIRSRKTD